MCRRLRIVTRTGNDVLRREVRSGVRRVLGSLRISTVGAATPAAHLRLACATICPVACRAWLSYRGCCRSNGCCSDLLRTWLAAERTGKATADNQGVSDFPPFRQRIAVIAGQPQRDREILPCRSRPLAEAERSTSASPQSQSAQVAADRIAVCQGITK
jgi:hypothetical protein